MAKVERERTRATLGNDLADAGCLSSSGREVPMSVSLRRNSFRKLILRSEGARTDALSLILSSSATLPPTLLLTRSARVG